MKTKFDYRLLDDNVGIVNQILPHKHKWAWDLYLKSLKNNWVPNDIGMAKDIAQWNSGAITEDEKLLVKRCLGFFAGSESLVSNNLLINVYKYITDAECRQYMSRQIFEETIHNTTIVYICDSLNLDIREVYEAYDSIPSIKAKDQFLIDVTEILDSARGDELKKHLLNNLIIYYIICEGMLFYSGFAMLLALIQQNKLPGVTQQIAYTLRDECCVRGTELLTPTGWKAIEEIDYSDLVAQYNSLGEIEFVKPLKLSRSYVDDVYSFTTEEGHMNLKVSENHRMLYLTKSGNEKIVAAKDATYNPYCKHLMAGLKYDGSKTKLTPFERFLVAFQADGSFPSGQYRNGNLCGYITVTFNLTKQRKITRLREILWDIGYEYKESMNQEGRTTFYIKVEPDTLYKTFEEWVDLTDVNYSWCQDFIEEVSHWDGHNVKESSGNRITYGSTIKSNCDVVQAIACLCNYRTHYTIRPDDRKETFSDYHRIQICKHKNYIRGGKVKKEKEVYKDFVYGVEVPSGRMIVKYCGAVAVTGNSLHVEFGTTLINQIRLEYPELWDGPRFESYFDKAVELEIAYAKDVLPRGILGLNWRMFIEYIQFIGNRRLEALNLTKRYPSKVNPFPWLTENMDLQILGNFFESREQGYKTGDLVDDF